MQTSQRSLELPLSRRPSPVGHFRWWNLDVGISLQDHRVNVLKMEDESKNLPVVLFADVFVSVEAADC